MMAETEFLPAALEVAESPPSPVGRAVLWMIVLAFACATAWSFIGRVDTVAVAQGRLVPSGRLRTLEPAESGIVRSINTREGEFVQAGQLLVALDPTQAEADVDSVLTELTTADLVRARSSALLSYLRTGRIEFVPPLDADERAVEAEKQLVLARISEHQARRSSMEQRLEGARASIRASRAAIDRLEETLPLVERQLAAQNHLAEQGFNSKLRVLQEQERYIAARQDLVAERAKYDEAVAQLASITRQIQEEREAFRGAAAREGAEAESLVATHEATMRKVNQREEMQQLTAPVSGTVHEVAVTTLGEMAEAGKPVVSIIAEGEELVVEALILNRDAGFVQSGQQAVIKLEAYPFTRYGSLQGIVERISPDAVVDDARGLVFPARVRILKSDIFVDGKPVRLSSGMGVSVEVVTGRRRIIDYLWSPIAKATREAGRER